MSNVDEKEKQHQHTSISVQSDLQTANSSNIGAQTAPSQSQGGPNVEVEPEVTSVQSKTMGLEGGSRSNSNEGEAKRKNSTHNNSGTGPLNESQNSQTSYNDEIKDQVKELGATASFLDQKALSKTFHFTGNQSNQGQNQPRRTVQEKPSQQMSGQEGDRAVGQ